MNNKKNRKPMIISIEQQKVISTPLRSRIIAMLYEKPMTSKQVATTLNKNPGTIYYHIQQLLKHGILDLENEQPNKGVIEKYYKSKANSFRLEKSQNDNIRQGDISIYLSDELLDDFENDLRDLIYKYGHLSFKERRVKEQSSYSINYGIKKVVEENEEL